MNIKIYKQITKKKEFSKLPREDIEMAFSHFKKRQVSDEEKIRLTRELLHKVFSSFTSGKLLSHKNKDEEWILRKHLSTRERLEFYKELYGRILGNESKKEVITIIDLGAGVNGFSYKFMGNVNYIGIDSIGQLVDLTNDYFKKNKISGKAYHFSLFDLSKVKELIKSVKGYKIIFLFKTLDSLEMLKHDYSKKLLSEIVPLVDKVVVSFATRSMIKKRKFKVSRNWITDFIKDSFNLLDDFELGGERYLVFNKNFKKT